MALNIQDAETDRLARELAAATGETITVAARRAIEERLARVRARQQVARQQVARHDDVLSSIIGRGRSRARLDERSD